jgi:hypothetical protein
MMHRKPPALAVWLLERFGYLGENSALLGDLLEEFRNGRSASWFWRQTATVLVKGRSPRQIVLRLDLLALFAGAVIQFPLSLVLWRFDLIPHVHGAGSILLASFAIVFGFLLAFVLTDLIVDRLAGRDVKELKLLILTTGGESRDLSALVLGRSVENFFSFLLYYCVAAAFWSRLPEVASLIVTQVIWLAVATLFLFAGLWVRPPRQRQAVNPVGYARKTWPTHELELSIALPDGRSILLQPDSAAQAVCTTGNEELVRAVFSHGATVEFLRRAIWFASARRWQALCRGAEAPPLTPTALVAWIQEASALDRVEQAFYVGDARPFWKRLSRRFRRPAA